MKRLMLVTAAFAILAANGVTEWPMERLTIAAGYFDLPKEFRTEENVKAMKDAGIDMVVHGRNGQVEVLDMFEKYGIKTILNGVADRVVHGGTKRHREVWPPAYYEKMRTKFVDHPAIAGIDMGDEPSALDAEYFGEVMAQVSELYPGKFPYFNLYPNYASLMSLSKAQADSQLGTATYAEYIDAFAKNIPNNVLCFDYYIYSAARRARAAKVKKYWENFEDVAAAARKTGRSIGIWLLSGSHPNYASEPTTLNEMRFQAFSSMAYGVKFITWGCYAGGWWTNQVILANGKVTEQYGKLKQVNHEIKAIAPVYNQMRCTDTHHVTDKGLSNGFFKNLKSESGSELVVGDMVGNGRMDPWRGLFIMTADDPFDTNSVEQVVAFKSAYPVYGDDGTGRRDLKPEADGVIRVKMRSNRYLMVTTKFRTADIDKNCDRTKLIINENRTVPPDYICFDLHPFNDDRAATLGVNTKRLYDKWDNVATAARKSGRAVCFVSQVNTKPNSKIWLSENKLRFQAGLALAYGTEWYSFGTFNQGGGTNCVINLDGTESEHFEKIRRIIGEMKRVGADYMRMRNVNTEVLNMPIRGNKLEFANGYFRHLRTADGSALSVGDMVARDTEERRRALLVAGVDDMTDEKRKTHEIRFSAFGQVTVKGTKGPIRTTRSNNGEYAFQLADSDYALIILDN